MRSFVLWYNSNDRSLAYHKNSPGCRATGKVEIRKLFGFLVSSDRRESPLSSGTNARAVPQRVPPEKSFQRSPLFRSEKNDLSLNQLTDVEGLKEREREEKPKLLTRRKQDIWDEQYLNHLKHLENRKGHYEAGFIINEILGPRPETPLLDDIATQEQLNRLEEDKKKTDDIPENTHQYTNSTYREYMLYSETRCSLLDSNLRT